MVLKNSLLVTSNSLNSGIGIYAWDLYKLGILENFKYIAIDTVQSHFPEKYVFKLNSILNKWVINSNYVFYFGGNLKEYVKKFDLIHLSDLSLFFIVKYNKNAVGTLHDLFSLNRKDEKFLWYLWNKKNLKFINKLKGLVVISDYIKKNVEEKFKDLTITRIHQWVGNEFMPRNKINSREKIFKSSDFNNKVILLNISTDAPRKNIDILTEIINNLDERFVLYRVGNSERIINKFKNKKQFIYENYVSHEIYPYLFNMADFYLHPSLNEGFGRPLIESIRSGLPVIASNVEISREVLSDKGIYADPYNVEEWVELILKNLDKKDQLTERILELSGYYSEERARREYEKFYSSLI
jgi:glycosyltransferase involved in cell wall biosynthesis